MESLMNILEGMRIHLRKLGYDEKGIGYILKSLENVLSLWKYNIEAARIIVESFSKYIKYPFGEKQFKMFLQEIDPTRISLYELEQELGIFEFDIENLLTPREKDEYYKDKREFIQRTIAERISSSYFPQFLRDEGIYQVLQSVSYRKLIPGNPPPVEKIRIIYTPSGGQPGYRKRR